MGAAAAWCEELRGRKAGSADHLDCRPLDPALSPAAAEILASDRFKQSFDRLPSRLAMVGLAHLVVCQNHLTGSFVDRLKERLGPDPEPSTLFRFCLPVQEYPTPVRIRELGSTRYEFRSDSTDFRFHEAALLKPQ